MKRFARAALILAGLIAPGPAIATCDPKQPDWVDCLAAEARTTASKSRTTDDYKPALGWQTRQPSLLCDSYFRVKDGEKAAIANDQKWLTETGCIIARGGLRLVLLDTSDRADAWRARVYGLFGGDGRDVYLRQIDAVNFANAGTYKSEKEAELSLVEMKRRFKRQTSRDSDLRHRIEPFGPEKVKLWIGPGEYYALSNFCREAQEDKETQEEWMARSKRESEAYSRAIVNTPVGQPLPKQTSGIGPRTRGARLSCEVPARQ